MLALEEKAVDDNYTNAFQSQTLPSSSSSSSSLDTAFDDETLHLQREYTACKKNNEFEALSLNR